MGTARQILLRCLATLVLACVLAPSAPANERGIQLDLQANLIVNGDNSATPSMALEQVGDINGDGRDDLAIGRAQDQSNQGVVYVLFSPAAGTPGGDPLTDTTRTLSSLTNPGGANEGFRVIGQSGDSIGSDLAGREDVNGDGRPDLVVSAQQTGRAYVIFGKTDDTTVSAGALGSGGYMIDNILETNPGNLEVTLMPDANGDGRAEVVATDPSGDRLPGERRPRTPARRS